MSNLQNLLAGMNGKIPIRDELRKSRHFGQKSNGQEGVGRSPNNTGEKIKNIDDERYVEIREEGDSKDVA